MIVYRACLGHVGALSAHTILYCTVLYCTVQYSTVLYSTEAQYSELVWDNCFADALSVVVCSRVQCSAMQCSAVQCSAEQSRGVHRPWPRHQSAVSQSCLSCNPPAPTSPRIASYQDRSPSSCFICSHSPMFVRDRSIEFSVFSFFPLPFPPERYFTPSVSI